MKLGSKLNSSNAMSLIASLSNATRLEELTIRNIEECGICRQLPVSLLEISSIKKMKLLRCKFDIDVMYQFSHVLKSFTDIEELSLISIIL